jgi:outer membrane protein
MDRKALPFLIIFFSVLARAQQPVTLERAVAMALERNPALAAVQEETAAAKARLGQARSARSPRLDFSQGFTRGNNQVYVFGTLLTQKQFSAADFALSRLNAPQALDNFQTRLDARATLFDFGRTRSLITGAKRMTTAAEFRAMQARQDLILRVVQAYSAVLVARRNLDAAREALRTAESSVHQVEALEQSGMVVTADLLSARVFRAQMRDRELRAENALHLSLLALGRELGASPDELPEPSEELREPGAAPMTLAEWEAAALKERPALRAAELEQEAATSGRDLAKAEYAPRLSAFADLEHNAETFGGPAGGNWTVGARLDLNVFAGGETRYRVAEAQARERQGAKNLEWFRSGVRLEVQQAWFDAQSAAERAAAARDAVSQARESLRIVQSRYDAGLVTITELLRAQAAQLDASAAQVAALGDWQSARAQLERAAGRMTADSALLRPAANAGGAQ